MDNKLISNSTEASSEGLLNNCSQSHDSYFTEEMFEHFANKMLINVISSYYHDESSDSEDYASIACKSIDNKNNKQEDAMCELAFTSNEKDINVSESNLQELTDTKLVDGKIVSMHKSSPSTAFPIMKILSPKSGPHTCLKSCFKCNHVFRLLDSPVHISRIRSIEKKNEFLKIEPSLCVDSCLCDFCWRYLEKTYKSIKSKNKKEETFSEKKFRLLERYVKKKVSKNKNQTRRCSINLCSQPYCQKMTVNECENIKKLFLTFEFCHLVFVQSKKQTLDFLTFPFCLCKIHNAMILVMSTCQICGDKLNAPFNTDDWSMYEMWNFVLIENNLPLILKPGMFICVTCKGHISKTNPGFPTIDLPHLQEYIVKSNAIRVNLYGESQYDLFNLYQGFTYSATPIVVPNTEEEKEGVRLPKVRFSDPLITENYSFKIGCYKNDTKLITSTALLTVAEQNRCTPTLESKDEGLEDDYYRTHDNSLSLNPQSNLKMTYNCKNKYYSNSDIPDSEMFAEADSIEILPYCEIKETNCIFVASDDSNLDSGNELVNLKSDHEIEMDKNDMKSITSTALLTVAEQNRYTPELESIDEEFEDIDFKTHYKSFQHFCQVNNVEIVENESVIISSRQVVSEHNEIENNQSKLNSHVICSAAKDRSSMDLKEVVEPPNAIVNPVSIKRKQTNIICDTISNKNVKKQSLNEKTTKSYKNSVAKDRSCMDLKEAYIVNKTKPNRKFARYVVDLAAFNFEPIYRAEKLNIIADHGPSLDDPGEIQFENNTESPPTPLPDNTQVTPTIGTRVNQRIRRPPAWLKDYVT